MHQQREVLLIQATVPDTGHRVWVTPGGGQEVGESLPQTLVREVFEETGHTLERWHGPVWLRRHQFLFNGDWYDQRETYFLCHVERFEPTVEHNPAPLERDGFVTFRWWQLAELGVTQEVLIPSELALLLDDLLTHGVPARPREIGR